MPRLDNEAQETFARRYVRDFHAGKAGAAIGIKQRATEYLVKQPEVAARITELNEAMLKASDITAARVMLELARVGFSDIRQAFGPDGALRPLHELSDDAAAAIAGVEVEMRQERDGFDIDLATGEQVPRFVSVRTAKLKRYDKNPALTTLAKHFKIIGDEGDGVNALASALADRLKLARNRTQVQPLELE